MHYQIQPDLAFREMEGQLLFLLADDTQLWSVNETGKQIWRQLTRREPLDRIAGKLARKFRIPQERARQDLDAFVEELLERGILLALP